MAEVVEHIHVVRRPEDVFSYVTDFSLFPQWQTDILSVRRQDDAPLAVGSKALVIRRLGPRQLPGNEEITEIVLRGHGPCAQTPARSRRSPEEGSSRSTAANGRA